MRRLFKFLHTMGAVALVGAMASLLVLMSLPPSPGSPAGYAVMLDAMDKIATWVLLPSLALTLLAGVLAIIANPIYFDAGWVWVKAALGLLVFGGGFLSIVRPIQEQAGASARLPAGHPDLLTLTTSLGAERNTLWVLLAVATASIALGVWRPRLARIPD